MLEATGRPVRSSAGAEAVGGGLGFSALPPEATGGAAASRAPASGRRRAALEIVVTGTGGRAGRLLDTLGKSLRRRFRVAGSSPETRAAEVLLVDASGLGAGGEGRAEALEEDLRGPHVALVVAVEEGARPDVVERLGLERAHVVDLDRMPEKEARREIARRLDALDSERIGAFAGVNGLVEVCLGSALRAFKVPFKGHALAYLQNLLLITYGKSLNGRGLFRINFISSMLKAFSPVGGTLRPMLYIFAQGSVFTLPVALFGWNLPAVVLGSVLMAWLTLTIKLLLNYLIFGMAFFDAYAGAIARVAEWSQIAGLSLASVLVGIFALKSLLAIAVSGLAWFGDMHSLVRRLQRRPRWAPAPRAARDPKGRAPSLRKSAWGALRDLVHWKFALFFFFSVLLMLFFANLSGADLASVAVRGLCISYVGFLAVRQIDFLVLGTWLDRKAGLGLGRSLPIAMKVLSEAGAQPGHGEAGEGRPEHRG
jgi:hypothetical protein